MTEEQALKLFARCYNRCDFSPIVRYIHKKASYESWDHFYKYTGRGSVAGALAEKANMIKEKNPPNRAYMGFVMVRHDIIGLRCEPCVLLTRNDPRQVIGVMRIKCTPFRMKHFRVWDGKGMTITRGDYVD